MFLEGRGPHGIAEAGESIIVLKCLQVTALPYASRAKVQKRDTFENILKPVLFIIYLFVSVILN